MVPSKNLKKFTLLFQQPDRFVYQHYGQKIKAPSAQMEGWSSSHHLHTLPLSPNWSVQTHKSCSMISSSSNMHQLLQHMYLSPIIHRLLADKRPSSAAQWLGHSTSKQNVTGSNPSLDGLLIVAFSLKELWVQLPFNSTIELSRHSSASLFSFLGMCVTVNHTLLCLHHFNILLATSLHSIYAVLAKSFSILKDCTGIFCHNFHMLSSNCLSSKHFQTKFNGPNIMCNCFSCLTICLLHKHIFITWLASVLILLSDFSFFWQFSNSIKRLDFPLNQHSLLFL